MSGQPQLQPDDSVFDSHQLHLPTVALYFGTDLSYRPFDTSLDIVGMQPVQNEKAADQRVATKLFDKTQTRVTGFRDDLQGPVEAGAMELHQQPDKLPRGSSHTGVGDRLDLLHQAADSLNAILKFLAI